MSDSLRKDETLTTADIAGRSTPTPRQVRSEARGPVPVPPPDRTDRPDRIAPDAQRVQVPSTARDAGAAAAADANATPGGRATPADTTSLFPDDELHNFRARWDQAQTLFVDEPRRAVEQADSLVANVVQRVAEQFANERNKLEERWSKGDTANTEDLRQAIKQYRAFFDRLLAF